MQSDHPQILPYLIALAAVFLVYRRLRRNFGQQRIRPAWMYVRIGILVLLGCTLMPLASRSGQFLAAELIGLAVGVGLGVWAASRTRYRMVDGKLHYIPHTYTGIAVSLLFVGRLVYRFVQLDAANVGGGTDMQNFSSPAMMRSPFTAGLLFVVVGYYVFYYSAVLWKSKRISPEDLEGVSASMPASRDEGAASG
jgi:NAD/NADP transhydrogenase beta subunit